MSDGNTATTPIRLRTGHSRGESLQEMLLGCDSRGEALQEMLWSTKPKILTPCPFEKKFALSSPGAEKEPY